MDPMPHGRFEVNRVIYGAMFGGTMFFWLVVVLLVARDLVKAPASGFASPEAALSIGAVLGVIACAAGLVVRTKVVRVAEKARRTEWPPEATERILSLLLSGWGAVMATGLFSGTLLFVLGDLRILCTAAPLCVVSMALTAPQRGWFDPSGP